MSESNKQQIVFSCVSGWSISSPQEDVKEAALKQATLSLDSLPASGGPRHSLC